MRLSRLVTPKVAIIVCLQYSQTRLIPLDLRRRELIGDVINRVFTVSQFGKITRIRVFLVHSPGDTEPDRLWLCFEPNIREQLCGGFTLGTIIESVLNQIRLLSGIEFQWIPTVSPHFVEL